MLGKIRTPSWCYPPSTWRLLSLPTDTLPASTCGQIEFFYWFRCNICASIIISWSRSRSGICFIVSTLISAPVTVAATGGHGGHWGGTTGTGITLVSTPVTVVSTDGCGGGAGGSLSTLMTAAPGGGDDWTSVGGWQSILQTGQHFVRVGQT
jgi:hypothetical protein